MRCFDQDGEGFHFRVCIRFRNLYLGAVGLRDKWIETGKTASSTAASRATSDDASRTDAVETD